MALASRVWDASAMMIDVPLENAINMRSVWTAWFQFWGKQHLHIDVLFFHNIWNVQHRIEWVQLDRQKKALKCNDTTSSHLGCQAAWQTPTIWMQRFAFECGFYFKFYEYSKLKKKINSLINDISIMDCMTSQTPVDFYIFFSATNQLINVWAD